MKPHKHAELIKAWADGAEIEYRYKNYDGWTGWHQREGEFIWHITDDWEYRIKPEPKPESIKGNMYIYNNPSEGKTWISPIKLPYADSIYCQYIGKIEVIK